jgi:hypothetical protein
MFKTFVLKIMPFIELCGTAGQTTDDTIWRIRFAYWITNTTEAHSEYAITIAFSQHKLLHERALICYVISTLLFFFHFNNIIVKTV